MRKVIVMKARVFKLTMDLLFSYWYIGIFVYLCSNENEGFQTHNGPIIFILVYWYICLSL